MSDPKETAQEMLDRVHADLREMLDREPTAEESAERFECDHGVTFDAEAARALLAGWAPESSLAFIMGSPGSNEVRKRWPRLAGPCPKGCGYNGIAYASMEHYIAGDW